MLKASQKLHYAHLVKEGVQAGLIVAVAALFMKAANKGHELSFSLSEIKEVVGAFFGGLVGELIRQFWDQLLKIVSFLLQLPGNFIYFSALLLPVFFGLTIAGASLWYGFLEDWVMDGEISRAWAYPLTIPIVCGAVGYASSYFFMGILNPIGRLFFRGDFWNFD